MSTFRHAIPEGVIRILYFYRTLFFQFRQLFFQAETVEFIDKVRHQLFHALDLSARQALTPAKAYPADRLPLKAL